MTVDPEEERATARALAGLAAATPPTTIRQVLDRLIAIEAYAAEHSTRHADDGIAAFTGLYREITSTIDDTDRAGGFDAPGAFLVELDLQFAERYFAALRTYALSPDDTPRCWRVLFDNRQDPEIPKANFAVAGVNAHINYDLSAALLMTWAGHSNPDDRTRQALQYRDYQVVNDIFAARMDGLREEMHTFLSQGENGAWWDRGANWVADLVVRMTRDLAWDEAMSVWNGPDRASAVATSDLRRGGLAGFVGAIILRVALPF